MIELVDGVREIGVSPAVNDIDSFVGVQMEQQQSVFLGGEIRSSCNLGQQEQGSTQQECNRKKP